jgi:hypothetical protein
VSVDGHSPGAGLSGQTQKTFFEHKNKNRKQISLADKSPKPDHPLSKLFTATEKNPNPQIPPETKNAHGRWIPFI